MAKKCNKKRVKYLCGGCNQLHDDTDYDSKVDKIWELISEEEFLAWVYTSIGDDNVDVMYEIDKRIQFVKAKFVLRGN